MEFVDMYNIHGRGMRLLSHPIVMCLMGIVSVLPHGHWGVVGLMLVELVAIWGTLPDIRSATLQARRWCKREFGDYW
jgi:hypothetical protein